MAFVTVSHFSKRYGDIQAVEDVSFEVAKGEIYALVGPDGAGKTTVIRSLANLLAPDQGFLSIAGLSVAQQFEQCKRRLGYMPQVFSLYADLTVEENLTFYGGVYGITGERCRRKRDFLYQFSNLEPFARRRAGALSGGMRQKLALSCALIHDPELLLLDEPTTGVDPVSRRQFWEILAALREQGVTIVVSTPYMDEVIQTDRASFIFRGRKLAEGTPQELVARYRGRVFYLDLKSTAETARKLRTSESMQVQRFGDRWHLYTPEHLSLQDVSELLQDLGVEPGSLTEGQAGLEDTFIQFMESRA